MFETFRAVLLYDQSSMRIGFSYTCNEPHGSQYVICFSLCHYVWFCLLLIVYFVMCFFCMCLFIY